MKTFFKIKLFTLFFIVLSFQTFAQKISGTVFELGELNEKKPIAGANVYWSETSKGTITDKDGRFSLKRIDESSWLVFSYVGYQNDTVYVAYNVYQIDNTLSVGKSIQGVEISNKDNGTYISRVSPIHTTLITGAELHKAACCNLSESFETNASVDVSYADAITGAKQIQLLGLAGVYSQIMTENLPNIYGLGSAFGLEYVPGHWLESIQVSKGTASVLQGYESITGQINANYKKPTSPQKLYFNGLVNDHGKFEWNANSSIEVAKGWNTIFLLHGVYNEMKEDKNADSFIDYPLTKRNAFMNKWSYKGNGSLASHFGIKILDEERKSGQIDFDPATDMLTQNSYGMNIKTKRYEGYFKLGYEMPSNPDKNIAFMNSATYHKQDSYFGQKNYKAEEKSLRSNIIYQTYIYNTKHKVSTGGSFTYDNTAENLNDSLFAREEIVPGTFVQYTFSNKKNLTLISGIRADYHNVYGLFYTPRFHFKYDLNEKVILRGSIGKGYRSTNIFAENTFLLANSRNVVVKEEPKMEEAINYGLNLTHYFYINQKELTVNIELYKTDFQNQVIIDVDQDVSKVYVYNLDGKSYSNSFQIETKYEILKGLDLVLAYRKSEVKTTINNELVLKPLVNTYKGLITMSYSTPLKKWQFDFTAQFNGSSRIPSTAMNPVEYRFDEESPEYTIINAQITKYFKKWNVYLGTENLTNFTQKRTIIAPDKPFGQYFDSSLIWGPTSGRKIYLGFRYIID